MVRAQKKLGNIVKPPVAKGYADELAALYDQHGALDPKVIVSWARENPESDLYSRFTWDDSAAAEQYRLLQARNLITEVEVVYPDGKKRQVYVSPIESRGKGGYSSLVEVLSDKERKARFLEQALNEYRRLGEKYESLKELAGVRAAVERVTGGRRAAKTAA